MKWFLSLCFCLPLFADEISDLIKDVPMDRQGINNTLNAITTDNPLFTPDGTPVESNLSCSSSSAFLQMFSHQNNNGDIDSLDIFQDTDFDGDMDYHYYPPVHISGICSRGIVSCNAGTFDECKYYSWQSDTNLKLNMQEETLINDIGTCMCINNSCRTGQNLATQKRNMEHLLGGITTALNSKSALTRITKNQVLPNYAEAYGVKSAGCGNLANAQVFSDMDNVGINQGQDNIRTNNSTEFTQIETGIFQDISTGPIATSNVAALRNCSINRTINFTTVNNNAQLLQSFESDINWEIFACATPNCLRLVHNKRYSLAGQNCQSKLHYIKFNDLLGDSTITLKQFTHAGTGGYFSESASLPPPYLQPFSCGGSDDELPWIDKTKYVEYANNDELLKNKIYKFTRPASVSSARYEIEIIIEYEPTTLCPVEEEIISDNCQIHENDQSCVLWNETQDEVQTLVNGVSTGIVPTPITKTLSSCALQFTRPYWYKKRTYKCDEVVTTDLTAILNRHEQVVSSATKDSYTDLRLQEDGSYQTEDNTFKNTVEIEPKGCLKKCKVKKKKQVSEVMNDGVKSNLVFSDTYVKYYNCANDICPKGQDETIVSACGCFSSFSEASLQMQLIRLTGKDILCVK